MAEKWYNSLFASYLGAGIGLAAMACGIGSCTKNMREGEAAIERAKIVQVSYDARANSNLVAKASENYEANAKR
jgi:hypothetical protein